MAKPTIKEYDEILDGKLLATGELHEAGGAKMLSKSKIKANELNKKAHNELILIGDDKCIDDPEIFIADLDELRERMKEDPFNENIQDNSFMIHILNSLPF